MTYKEQMQIYIESLKNSIANNKREIKFLEKTIKFNLENIEYNKKINDGVKANLSNAIKEYEQLENK